MPHGIAVGIRGDRSTRATSTPQCSITEALSSRLTREVAWRRFQLGYRLTDIR